MRVKESGIRGAGLGLFAAQDFQAKRKILPYKGEVLTAQQVEDTCPGDELMAYGLRIGRNRFVNAWKSSHGAARYANAPRGTNRQANATLTSAGNLSSKRKIKKGKEILVGYGPAYWPKQAAGSGRRG